MINRYYKFSKISEAKFRHLLRCFALDLTAMDTATLTGLSLRSVTAIYDKLRQIIVQWCEQTAPVSGTVEVDESYFGPRRIPGKRGREASQKTIVFGIFQRAGGCTLKLCPIRRNAHCNACSEGMSLPKALSIPTAGAAMMTWWMWDMISIFV